MESLCLSTNWQEDERQRGEGEKTRREGNIIKKNIKGKFGAACFCTCNNGDGGCCFFFKVVMLFT